MSTLPPSEIMHKAFYFSAECYRKMGQDEKAIELYQTILDRWPYYEYGCSSLVRIYKIYKSHWVAGDISYEQYNALVRSIFEQLVAMCPSCAVAEQVRDWPNEHTMFFEGGKK